MTATKRNRVAAILAASVILALAPSRSRADDFGKIVHSIESNYHVHRNHRFVMFFARVVVKCAGVFAGVRSFKAALFERQSLAANPDSALDEVVQAAGDHGWQSIVKSYSRHGDEHDYIYARAEAKDMKLLIVNVQADEAAVIQVKINPGKLSQFIDEHE